MRKFLNDQNGDLFDGKSFPLFFKEWFPSVVCFSSRFTMDLQAAEDIAEDAFIALWERRKNFGHLKAAKSFLYTAARNASLNWLAAKNVREENSKQLGYLALFEDKNALHEITRAESLHKLAAAINELPLQCRKVIDLLYLEGKSREEAAKVLNLSINTIKSQRTRAISLLRKKVNKGY
jgi:RNA polymerase sigma-70 factor (family 1)